jgi:hypothetical protein
MSFCIGTIVELWLAAHHRAVIELLNELVPVAIFVSVAYSSGLNILNDLRKQRFSTSPIGPEK